MQAMFPWNLSLVHVMRQSCPVQFDQYKELALECIFEAPESRPTAAEVKRRLGKLLDEMDFKGEAEALH